MSNPEDRDVVPAAFWRSLGFFSLYRIAIGLVFLVVILVYGDTLNVAAQDSRLFLRTTWAYLVAATAFVVLLRRHRPKFQTQLSIQVTADVAFLTLMMYASGGQKSGIAVLILVVVAGAGLVGQGRMTLFYAAMASVAMLLEESWRALIWDVDPADFFRTGLICLAFFGTAITAQLLARRVVANEELARERGEALERQLRIGARVIRDMDQGILVVDGQGKVQQSNPAAEHLLSVNITNGNLASVSQSLAARYSVWSANRRETVETLRSANGNPLRVRYLPDEDASGSALVYLEDIDRVQQQAQQLKLAALGRLTANIAHEIRNPLASISHAAELLGEEETDPLRMRLANIVADNARRLNRLVTDVLELGRRDRASPEQLRWRVFLQSFLEEFSLHDSSVGTRVSVPDEDIEFSFDRAHLHRVLWNLLANALRHSTHAPGAIRLFLNLGSSQRPEIHVVDDGPGIDDTLRAQIFEPFFTTHGGGTGLGLYIARELCEANGARLELLANDPGAHFRIVLEGRT